MRGDRDRVHVCTPTAWDSSSPQRRKNTLFCFHLRTHSRFAAIRPDNHKWQRWHWPLSREAQKRKDGLPPDGHINHFIPLRSEPRKNVTTSICSGPDHDRTMHTPRLPQRAAAGSGQVLIRADLDDRVSRPGWRPNWPRLSGMLQHYQRNPFQNNGRPRDEFGSSNAKGRCHCNPRCTFSFLALQDTGGGDSSSEGSPITTQLRSWLFNSQHGNQRQETGEMEPDRQSIPIVPPCAETSKHWASSFTAIVFLLVARDGHRNGRFPTQNNTRLTENLWVPSSFCDRHPDPRQQHPEGISNHPAYAEMTGFGV